MELMYPYNRIDQLLSDLRFNHHRKKKQIQVTITITITITTKQIGNNEALKQRCT